MIVYAEKRMQLDKEQSTVRTPARTDRTKKVQDAWFMCSTIFMMGDD